MPWPRFWRRCRNPPPSGSCRAPPPRGPRIPPSAPPAPPRPPGKGRPRDLLSRPPPAKTPFRRPRPEDFPETPLAKPRRGAYYIRAAFSRRTRPGASRRDLTESFRKKFLTGWQREGKVSPCAARPEGRRRGPPEGEARTLKTGYCEMNRIERCPPGEPSPPKGRGSRRKPRSNGCGSDAALFKRRV